MGTDVTEAGVLICKSCLVNAALHVGNLMWHAPRRGAQEVNSSLHRRITTVTLKNKFCYDAEGYVRL